MIEILFDPLFRAPFWATILICLIGSLIGVIFFVQRKSLLIEMLSHVSYPGVMAAIAIAIFCKALALAPYFVAIFAVAAVSLSLYLLKFLTKKCVSFDSALTFLIATFFGWGILIISYLQSNHPYYFQLAKSFFYGQSAILEDRHIVNYGFFLALIIVFIFVFYKDLVLTLFEQGQAHFFSSRAYFLEKTTLLLGTFAVLFSMQSVGLILVSGIMIAPALAARLCTNRLSSLFLLSALIGGVSAALGVIFSYLLSKRLGESLPSGPLVVLIAQGAAFFALLFSSKNGWIIRGVRMVFFRFKCRKENLVKMLWRHSKVRFAVLKADLGMSIFTIISIVLFSYFQGLLGFKNKHFFLTEKGRILAEKVVRLHRLWELYLVQELYMQKELVHQSAEQMEHILTPAIEKKLTAQLKDPLFDPHNQPIPRGQQ